MNSDDTLPAKTGSLPLAEMMSAAMQQGEQGVVMLERLIEMSNAERTDQRRLAYHRAMSRFQATCPPIPRRKGIPNKQGVIKYKYAPLDVVVEVAGPHLDANGLSWAFDVAYLEGNAVEIGCTLSHEEGHSERSSLRMPGVEVINANRAQNEGARITYGKRLAFLNVSGVVTADEDTDAVEPHDAPSIEPVTEAQAATLQALCEEVSEDAPAFLKRAGVDMFAAFPARMYARAVSYLEGKRGGIQ